MKTLERCAEKVIIEGMLLSRDNLTLEEQICLYNCDGQDNKCGRYYIIEEECVGL